MDADADADADVDVAPTFLRHYVFPRENPFDPSVPAMQPGAGIYTSPLTQNVDNPLPDILRIIHGVLDVLHMPFKYEPTTFKVNICALKSPQIIPRTFFSCFFFFLRLSDLGQYHVAVYFTSGFARYSVRVWSRETVPGTYAVEIMRERVSTFILTNLQPLNVKWILEIFFV